MQTLKATEAQVLKKTATANRNPKNYLLQLKEKYYLTNTKEYTGSNPLN